jgi:hypothetical protein
MRGGNMTRAIISILFLLVGCQRTTSPDLPPEPSPDPSFPKQFDRGVYSGTFVISRDDGTGKLYVLEGTLTITFADTTYTYSGATQPGSTSGSDLLTDQGSYRFTAGGVYLYDMANMLGAVWAPSLYLSGEYHYKVEGGDLSITQESAGRTTILQLSGVSEGG